MSTPNVWAIRAVAKATFYDLKTGKAKVQLKNLKTSGIENSADTVYAQGGEGNNKIVGFSGNRGAKVPLQDAVFTNEVIAMMTGNDIKKGVAPIIQRDEIKIINNKATLNFTPATPVNGLNSVYLLSNEGTHEDEIEFATGALSKGTYSITGKELTFFDGEFEDNTEIVAYYKTQSGASAKTITISSDKFAGTYRVILDVIVRAVGDKQDYAAQIDITNAKMEDGWKIDMAAGGDPSVFDIPLEILKPQNSTQLYTMTIYDANEMV